jgi:LacI family transcriptional regulator, gluconate utilization system Gnt-I transcriptional repressor
MRAVFCSSDELAPGVLTQVFARGIRVPDDLAVVDFGGADFAAYLCDLWDVEVASATTLN